MILIQRKEDGFKLGHMNSASVTQQADGSYTVKVDAGTSKVTGLSTGFSCSPKGGESIDVVDAGKRIVSVMEKRIRWYGAAPK